MFIKFHAMREDRDERGFTLIELLVVILIIAILAAIAIPAFLRQREKGYVAKQQSALKNAATAAESYAVGTGGNYSLLDETALTSNGYNPTENVTLTVVGKTASSYCLSAVHDPATVTWYYSSATGKPTTTACTTGAS